MDHKIRLGVDKIPCLFTNRLNNLRMAMTCVGHANSTREVEQFASILSVDVRTFGALRHEVEDTTPNGRHVRKILFVESVGCHVYLS
jgi:hypothetical protein